MTDSACARNRAGEFTIHNHPTPAAAKMSEATVPASVHRHSIARATHKSNLG